MKRNSTMTALALYNRSAQKAPQLVTVHGWDAKSLYVRWADGLFSWSPRYLFDHGYEQFQCAS